MSEDVLISYLSSINQKLDKNTETNSEISSALISSYAPSDGVGIAMRLSWIHLELKKIEQAVTSLAFAVTLIAVTVLVSVIHHW